MKDISQHYHFSDFTLNNYHSLLSLAKKNYEFRLFNEEYQHRSALLRHDVEFSIPITLEMAKIEADLGIRSTYFVQVHCEYYNTLEKMNIVALKEIIELGHQIGLHFDSHFWAVNDESQLDKCIEVDRKVLETYLETEVKAFSFHNNTDFTLSCRKHTYGNLLNVYSEHFRQKYAYNADSLGYWRFERLEDRLLEAKEEAIQILIHDGMWQHEVLPPRQRVFKVIDDRVKWMKDGYDKHLATIGQRNIDWDGDINGND